MHSYLLVIAAMAFLAYVKSDACIQCNSSTDVKCATSPEQYMAKDCTNINSKCYTRVMDGHTIRGCASDLSNQTYAECHNEMECVVCSYYEGCNRQIFPAHRSSCLQCQGNSTGVCALNTYSRPTICPLYQMGDKCFIRYSVVKSGKKLTTSFERGCLSSAQARKLCIKDGNCFVCEGSGCNNLESNSTQIPIAKDSATAFGYSFFLTVACAMVLRYF